LSWISRQIPERGPKRLFAIAILINTMGNGMFMASSALYFTQVVHLSTGRVGIGLTVAGLIGLLAGVPIGDLADRRGSREVFLVALVVQAATMLSLVFVHSFTAFMCLVSLDMLASSSAGSSRGALIRRIGGEGAPVFRAQVRAIANAGIPVGALAAAVAVQIDTRASYSALIIANSSTFLVCALMTSGVPSFAPLPRPERNRRWSALADRPFVSFALINGVMAMQYQVPLLPLPIWIATQTDAPRWIISAALALNTILCVLLQVRFGARVDTLRAGSSAMRSAGLAFLLSCPLMALIADVPALPAVMLTLSAVALHTIGELWHSSASYTVSFELAPKYAQGQYQGLLGMGAGAGGAIAPGLLMLLCIDGGQLGWLVVGFLFAAAGIAAQQVVHWAERTSPALVPNPVAEKVAL
jgi:MFS family permease